MDRVEKLHRLAAAVRWLSQVDEDLLADDVAESIVLRCRTTDRQLDDEERSEVHMIARAAAMETMARVTEATARAMACAWPA